MIKQVLIVLALLSDMLYLYGCYVIKSINITDTNTKELKENNITAVITRDDVLYEFDRSELRPKPYFFIVRLSAGQKQQLILLNLKKFKFKHII